MDMENTITKVTQTLKRPNGAEVKIVAKAMYGTGLTRSIDVYVLRRDSSNDDWILCDNRPHQEWKKMTVDEYVKHGRSEMLQAVSPGEILKLTSLIGKAVDAVDVVNAGDPISSISQKEKFFQNNDNFFDVSALSDHFKEGTVLARVNDNSFDEEEFKNCVGETADHSDFIEILVMDSKPDHGHFVTGEIVFIDLGGTYLDYFYTEENVTKFSNEVSFLQEGDKLLSVGASAIMTVLKR